MNSVKRQSCLYVISLIVADLMLNFQILIHAVNTTLRVEGGNGVFIPGVNGGLNTLSISRGVPVDLTCTVDMMPTTYLKWFV